MESEHEETSVTLGISIPIDSSKNREVLKEYANQRLDVLSKQLEFANVNHLLDPNLGIMGQLPSADIDHEKNAFNPWNIEPHFLRTLPQYNSNLNENYILVVGGLNPSSVLEKIPPDFDIDDFVLGSSIFQYIVDSGIWKYYGTMIEPRCYHACVLDGHYLYITGGYSLLKRNHGEMIAIASTDRLNLIDRTWKYCANMVMSRATHAVVAYRRKLYAFGGRNSQGSILASVEMYDTHQDLWFEITSLPRPTMGLSATCIMDSVWLIGGITDHFSEDPAECLLANVFSFDLSTKKWHEEVSLPYACAFSTCISNDCALWLIGGCTVPKNPMEKNMISNSSVLKLSLTKKPKWERISSLLYPKHASTAVLYGLNIYVLGGVESNSKCASDKVEVIDIIRNVSTMCTKMPVPIAGSTSILIVSEKSDYPYMEEESDALSTFFERTNYNKPGVEDSCTGESSKTSITLENAYEGNGNKYLPIMSPINHLPSENFQETFSNQREKIKISVTQESSNLSERNKIKKSGENYYSGDSSETSGTVEDVYNVNKNKCLSPISSISQLHNEIKESFPKTKKDIEMPVTDNSFKENDLFIAKVNELKTKRVEKIRYRTSMEIFLDSGETGLYALKKETSQASKWLDYLKEISLSDEKIHKEVFQSKEPELHIKTDVVNAEINLKRPEVKFSGKDESLAVSSSTCVQSFSSYHHEPFIYVKSNVKEKVEDVNVDQNFQDRRKTTSKETVTSEITDLKSDNLPNDAPDEIKVIINEDHFPVILLIGGEYSKKTDESRFILTYHCNENVWNYAGGKLPENRCHHSAVFLNNKIYIIGGFKSENSKFNKNITNKIIYFDISDKHWHNIADMNHPRAHHSAVVLKNKIYILGGRDQSGRILSSIEVYDESCGIWKECASLPYPVLGAAVFPLDDSIHIFGGITYEEDDEKISLNIAIFDTKKNSWITDFGMPIPLAFCGIANDLNSVWLFGGLTVEENNLVSSKDIFKSDIVTKSWINIDELYTPRLAPMTVSIGKKIYIIAGHSTQEKKEVLTCELIDLDKNEHFLLKNLPIGISGRACVAITK